MNKPPAFQLYADDFLAGTMTMTNEEVGAYFRLLCLQWSAGCIRDQDINRISRMTSDGTAMAQPCMYNVTSKFVRSADDTLRNARLEAERSKQREFRENRSKSGQKGAAARWNDGTAIGTANGKPMAQPMANTMAKDGSPSPSPIKSTHIGAGGRLHGIPATADEVIAYGATLNPKVDEARCRAFWAHYEGQARTNPNGDVFWITSGDAVVTNWKAKLPAFEGKTHGNNQHPSKPGTDRNAGTANASKASQYRGVGKVVGL